MVEEIHEHGVTVCVCVLVSARLYERMCVCGMQRRGNRRTKTD